MATLSYRTAGESHGRALLALVEGLPADLPLDLDLINGELARRQGGYGRGGRQKIETDKVELLTGVRQGKTIASPLTLMLVNKDSRLDDPVATPALHQPRPGHADLAGSIKWLTTDCRATLERASARETAARVAAGGVAKCLLRAFGIEVFGHVTTVGPHTSAVPELARPSGPTPAELAALISRRDASETYTPDAAADAAFVEFIRQQKVNKDTAGGIVETQIFGLPIGLGSSVAWDTRLDSRIAGAVVGIQAFKGVEIGLGFAVAGLPGSKVHDEIFYDAALRDTPQLGFTRTTNNAGGLEGGMTNGMPLVVRGAMKPISTLGKPLRSVDLATLTPAEAGWERSDISAISAASVVMEAVIAFELARSMVEKFAGDSMQEMTANYRSYLNAARTIS